MMRWIQVFRYEARQQFRRKSYLFITFVLPLLAVAAFYGYQFIRDATRSKSDKPSNPVTQTAEKKHDKIGYVDLTSQHLFPAPDTYQAVECQPTTEEANALMSLTSSQAESGAVIKRISSPYCLRSLIFPYPSFEAGKKALDDKKIDMLYVVEPNFVDKGKISAYMQGFSISGTSTRSVMQDFVLRSLLYNVKPADYEALYLRLSNPASVSTHEITATGASKQNNENKNVLMVYGFGLTMMFAIFWGGGYLMQSVVQEKESRIIEIVLSSVPPNPLLLGKILAMGMLSLLQVAMYIGVFSFLMGQADKLSGAIGNVDVSATTLVLAGVYFLLGFLLFGSLMAAIGALSTTVRDSQNFVVVVTLPAALPFFFLTIFAEEPNGSLAVVLSLIPFTASLSMIMRLAVTSVPAGQLALSLGLLVAGVAAAIWLAGRLFRVNTLLMGSMPKIRDIPKLIRG